jgi:hypothetical protein
MRAFLEGNGSERKEMKVCFSLQNVTAKCVEPLRRKNETKKPIRKKKAGISAGLLNDGSGGSVPLLPLLPLLMQRYGVLI